MKPASNMELVRAAFDAFAQRDVEALLRVSHPDIEYFPVTRSIVGRPDPYRGHEGMRAYFEDVSRVWQELEVVPRRFSVGDDHVVVYGRARGLTVDGTVVDQPADWIWKIRDGLIVWGCVYGKRDAPELLQTAAV